MCEIGSCLIVIKIPAITERSYWSVELRFKNEISTKMERLKSVPFLLHFHCLNRQWRKTSELAICLQSNVLQIVINDVSLNLTFKKYIYHQLVPALDDGPTFFVAVEDNSLSTDWLSTLAHRMRVPWWCLGHENLDKCANITRLQIILLTNKLSNKLKEWVQLRDVIVQVILLITNIS